MSSNTTLTPAEVAEVGRLQNKYSLTKKQAVFVKTTVNDAPESSYEATKRAGYSSRSMTTKAKRSEKVQKAIEEESERIAMVKMKAENLVSELNKDAKGTLEKKLAEHAEDPNVTPNQTRAVELLGKMRGAFIERIEIDPGEFFRSNMGRRIIPEDFSLE